MLTLLDAVRAADIPHIAPADRDYVASEMTAFLTAWLYTLPCPRLNPPSLNSLCGELHPLHWRAHALRCGLHVGAYDPVEQAMGGGGSDCADADVTIVGDLVIGSEDTDMIACARRLAGATRLPMLRVKMKSTPAGPALTAASALPNLARPDVAAAVIAWFPRHAA